MYSSAAPGLEHRGQEIASVSQQGEESPRIRTEAYHHDSVGFALHTQDTEDGLAKRGEVTACLRLVEQKIPSGPRKEGGNDTKEKEQ